MMKKVVIIEDELILQELHMHYVTNLGHDVVACFENGLEAIEYFKENYADLILMDIRLEGDIDGIETAQKIQETIDIPIVYVSANTNDNVYNRALSTNMNGYLSKPLSPKELEEVIESIVSLTDSIIYAQRIQKQLFAREKQIKSIFKEYIYLNRPKDIVSGDFCFIGGGNLNDEIIVAVGDCTGHGVPGALLSIVCYNILKNLTTVNNDLNEIISQLYFELRTMLSPIYSEYTVHDSLDIAIFKLTKGKSEIEIIGSKREVIYFNSINNTTEILKLRKGEDEDFADSLIKINFNKDDVFYFYSDGITDQFGGDADKKLSRKRLLSFLDSEHSNNNLSSKQVQLNIFLRKWQGKTNQTDDMILLALKPSSCY
jgi:CheY-like chemotaxis protein